ncbi:MAG: NUDIX hydrolase [Thermodesulfobacteriota bacterium]|nr:NUDIX hydrolase [Thermodesulfobacteriota bacterium]
MENKVLEKIEIIDERKKLKKNEHFLNLKRLKLKNIYTDGSESRAYQCDILEKPSIDSVAIVLYHIDNGRRIWVGLREGIRPPAYFRKDHPLKKILDNKIYKTVKELVAGGLEEGEYSKSEIDKRACIEIKEEAGFIVNDSQLIPLGGGVFSSPGVDSEKIYFRAVEVSPKQQKPFYGDGSPMEEGARFIFLELNDALLKCHTGEIEDAKTELGIRRLATMLGYIPELKVWKDELKEHLSKNYSHLKLGENNGTD